MVSEAVRLERERRKTLSQAEAWQFARTLASSPLVQILGSVALAELLERQGVLSAKWAGACEGGVIAMVGMQAYKDMGLIGSAGVLSGMGLGAASSGDPLTAALQALSLAGGNPGPLISGLIGK